MKKILALVLALALTLTLGMTALADGEIVSVMYGGGTPESMDPALNSASVGSNLIRLAFAGLMGTQVTDGEGTLAPEMAESYTMSADGLVYTFVLREGLKWSDGSDFYASDFVKSWNRAADEDLGAAYGFLFDVIDGYGTEAGLNMVADDEARTLVVTLKAPCAYFLELCAFPVFYPVKVDLADNEGVWATNPETFIGTGAFKMVSYKVDDVIEYVKNENYWNAENVKLGGVNAYLAEDSVAILAAYEAGAVQFIQSHDPAEFDRLKATYGEEFQIAEQIGTYYVLFNVHKDLSPEGKTLSQADQSKVRYGLGLMVNRQDLVDYVTMGGQVAATGFYPVALGDGANGVVRGEGELYTEWYTGTATYSEEYPAYTEDQVEGAKILMDYYTYTGSLENGDLTFTDVPGFEFSFNQNATNSAIVQYVQECWNVFGIQATINTEAWATLQTKLSAGDAEASRMGWVADFNDCVNFLEIFISASGNNYPRLGQSIGDYTRNTENTATAGLDACWGKDNDKTWAEAYDALVTEIKNETDTAKRAELCAEAEEVLMATGAVAPLYYYTNPYMLKSNVENLAVLAGGDIIWNYAYIAE